MKKPTKAKPAPITYARAGGPPKNWPKLEVCEGSDVCPMADVIEVDANEGWCIRYKRGADGKLLHEGGYLVTERVEGAFTIRVGK